MLRIALVWALNAASLIFVAYVVPGITLEGYGAAFIAALVLGLVNTMIRPVLVILTLPITVVSLGLFYWVLNGLLFWAVGNVLHGFAVSGFWAATSGAFLYGLIAWILSKALPSGLLRRRTKV